MPAWEAMTNHSACRFHPPHALTPHVLLRRAAARCSIFNMFDSCLLLSGGGHVVYAGPQHLALPYVTFLGFYPPPGENAADFLLDVTAGACQFDKFRLHDVGLSNTASLYVESRAGRWLCMRNPIACTQCSVGRVMLAWLDTRGPVSHEPSNSCYRPYIVSGVAIFLALYSALLVLLNHCPFPSLSLPACDFACGGRFRDVILLTCCHAPRIQVVWLVHPSCHQAMHSVVSMGPTVPVSPTSFLAQVDVLLMCRLLHAQKALPAPQPPHCVSHPTPCSSCLPFAVRCCVTAW